MRGLRGQVFAVQGADVFGLDVGHAVVGLEGAFDDEGGVLGDDQAEAFEEGRIDDGVGDAGFVLQGQEHHALGGAGALAADD